MDSPIDKPKDYPSDTQLEDAIAAGKSLSGTPKGNRVVHVNLVITDGKGAGMSERFQSDLDDHEGTDKMLADIASRINGEAAE